MRSLAGLTLVGLLAGMAPASDPGAKAVVERAIRAHGGAAALRKAATVQFSAKGTRSVAGRAVAYTRKVEASLPGRMRLEITLGGRVATTVLLDGDKGQQSDNGKPVALRPQRVKELQGDADMLWLATLVPLLKEGVTLSLGGETKADGEAAVSVKAVRKGHPDTTLSFSKKSGLLVRVARRAPLAGKEAALEWAFSGHKEVSGVQVPTKEVQSVAGKKVAELTLGDWSFPAKIDAARFARP